MKRQLLHRVPSFLFAISNEKNPHTVACAHILETSYGDLVAVADEKYLYCLQFINSTSLSSTLNTLSKHPGLNLRLITGTNTLINRVQQQLELYHTKQLHSFTIPYKLYGTRFQERVWNFLTRIPYGSTASYKDLAKKVGSPLAYRAVGNASNRNPITIIIPCHRVIGTNGTLTGYASGLNIKKSLLLHEGYSCV